MKKTGALIISLLIMALIIGNFIFFLPTASREKVFVIEVTDGDTIKLQDGRIIRLANINTPEKGEPFYNEAKDFLKEYVNKSVEIEILGTEKYGRVLARGYDNEEINLEIVKRGFGTPFLVSDSEIKVYENALESAKSNELGLWKKSSQYKCLTADIHKKDEYVIIEDHCNSIITGWSVRDESTKKYVFETEPADEFILYSGSGKDTQQNLYWNKENVWNDDKDSIYIRDDKGLLVYHYSYGY